MNNPHTIRTASFVGVALIALSLAWLSRPYIPRGSTDNLVGQELFPDFKDPLAAVSLEIVKYDESTATLQPFKVALVNNRWSIPSHDNYPADAKNQLAEAAASLVGLKILEVVTDRPGDHALYGVVDPDPNNLETGATGVGMRVVMRDKDDQELVNLIIGKEVPGQEGLRYVRRGKQDPVYVVALKTDKLSTRFEDWIERDLLQLNTWDIRQVTIDDYSIDIVQGIQIPRSRMVLDYDDREVKWTLRECQAYENDRWVDRPLAEEEELDTTKLNDMKWALDDLKIVDVRRKPAGMTANLRELGEIKFDTETIKSLAERGFYVVRVGNRVELLSSEGEVTVLMKDGVQYVLRFGGIAAGSRTATEGEGSETNSGGTNRYLFVMAEFNPEGIPKPELTPLPELPPEAATSGETAGDGSSTSPAAEAKQGNGATSEEPGALTAPATQGESAPAATAENAQPAEGEPKAQPPEASEGSAQNASTQEAAKTEPAQEQKPQEVNIEEIKKKREEIEKENKRKLEEYEEKLKKGQERVKELNERFAEWYYVVSDEVYRKIRLSRGDIVRKKTQISSPETEQQSPQAEPKAEESVEAKSGETAASQPTEEAAAQKEAATTPAANTEVAPAVMPQAAETSAETNTTNDPVAVPE